MYGIGVEYGDFTPILCSGLCKMHKFTYKMRFFIDKICIYKIKVVILHRQTKTTTQKHLEQ